MRPAIALLLLALAVAANADTCPSGMSPVSKAERGKLRAVGVKAFTTNAQAGVCDKLPAVILDFSAFNIDIQPLCTTSGGETTLFRVVLDNPCNDGASDTVHMTIDTKPAECHKVYDPRLARWGWHTPVPGNMRPLMCPTGFRHANSKDKALLTAFVNKQFTEVEMPHRLMNKKFVCTVGIQTLRWRYQNGCVQTWPKKGVSPYVMAQAKVTYSCYGSSKTFTLGIDGEGTFKTYCDWAVTFEPVVT